MEAFSNCLTLDVFQHNSNTATESSESRAQENNENPVIKNNELKKVSSDWTTCPALSKCRNVFLDWAVLAVSQDDSSQNMTPDAGTEATPVKRRGRPPKTAAAPAEKEGAAAPTSGGAGRGRKRAADSNTSAESINIKMSKQQQQNDEGTKRQIDLQR